MQILDTLKRTLSTCKAKVFKLRWGMYPIAGGEGDPPADPPPTDPPAPPTDKPFFDGFAADVKGDPSITKYKTVEELAKGHIALSGKLGGSIAIPKDNASDTERGEFYNKCGRPDKSEEYKFTQVEGLHESIKITPESDKAYKDFSHSIGLSNAQADKLNKWYLENVSNVVKQDMELTTKTANEAETKLIGEWGQNHATNMALAKNVALKFGGEDIIEAMGEAANNPAVLKMLAGIGKAISEDSINRLGVSGLSAGSKEEALQKIKEMESNTEHALHKPDDPNHKEAVKTRTELYKVAYPKEG